MAHNNEMMGKGKENWKGKARIIGLSIDQDVGKLKSHVKDKGWTKVEHYHVSNGKCTASADLGSGGVPHCILVDTKGVIVWMGHPASIDLEASIDKLLAGEKLPGGGAGGDDDEEGGAGNKSGAECAEIVSKFKAQAEAMVKDEGLVAQAKEMQRAFFVCTTEGTFDASKGCIMHAVTFHTLAMGGTEEGRKAIES